MKLGIATVITDEGIRSQVLVNALGNRGFDSFHVTENSHLTASPATLYPGREFYRSYDRFVALTAAVQATSKLLNLEETADHGVEATMRGKTARRQAG